MAGPRNSTTSKSGSRMYSWRGESYHSVTTIIGGGVPKPALLPWGIKMVAESAVEAIENGYLAGMVEQDREGAIKFLKGTPYAKRDAAADLGTLVHDAAEAYALKKPYPAWSILVRPYMLSFVKFLEDFSPTFLATEASVYSRTERYAGTLDAIVELTLPLHSEPGKYIIDTKSGRGIYAEIGLQLSAYRNAEFIGLPDGSEETMPQVDGALGLHLTPTGYRLIEVRADAEVFKAFLYAREVYRWSIDTSKTVLGVEYTGSIEPVPA